VDVRVSRLVTTRASRLNTVDVDGLTLTLTQNVDVKCVNVNGPLEL